ncbi:MAG: putative 40S ribosomal protein S2, partial [Streblomastix strix]
IRGVVIAAKLAMIPIRLGYWGNNIGQPHTVAMKVTGKCGSVRVRLVPAPRGTGLVAAPVSKKLLSISGVEDVFTSSSGKTNTMGNFIKATFFALSETYKYLTPDLWPKHAFPQTPYQENSQWLADEIYNNNIELKDEFLKLEKQINGVNMNREHEKNNYNDRSKDNSARIKYKADQTHSQYFGASEISRGTRFKNVSHGIIIFELIKHIRKIKSNN